MLMYIMKMYTYRLYWFSFYGGLAKSEPSEFGFLKIS